MRWATGGIAAGFALLVERVAGADRETRRLSSTGPANAPAHHCQRSQETTAAVRRRMTTVSTTTPSFDSCRIGSDPNWCTEHAFQSMAGL